MLIQLKKARKKEFKKRRKKVKRETRLAGVKEGKQLRIIALLRMTEAGSWKRRWQRLAL